MGAVVATALEAFRASVNQKLQSALVILMVAGLCVAVLTTTGRGEAARSAVLDSFEQAGTRSIVVRAEVGAGIDSSVVHRLDSLLGLKHAWAFGEASDYSNAAIEGGARVNVRPMFSPLQGQPIAQGLGAASPAAQRVLGVEAPAAYLLSEDGLPLDVVSELPSNAAFDFLEPLVVVPAEPSESHPISVLVLECAKADQVAALAAQLPSLLAPLDSSKVTIATSSELAALRDVVGGQLGDSNRLLMASIFATMILLQSGLMMAFVMLRRRDFGRRRALGASKSFVAGLVLLQSMGLGAIGAASGCCVALLILNAEIGTLPPVAFQLALTTLAVTACCLAATPPALLAANRQPAKELRVP